MKSFFGIALLLAIYPYCFSQNIPGDRTPLPGEEKKLQTELKNSTTGIQQIESLLKLSSYYLNLPGDEKDDFAHGLSYAAQAKQLSSSFKFQDGYNEAMLLTGRIHMIDGQEKLSKLIFDTAIASIQKLRESNKSPQREARALRQLADINLDLGNYELSETQLLNIIKIYQANNFLNLHYTYERLTELHVHTGDYEKALSYSLQMLKSMKTTGDSASAGSFYRIIGWVYRFTGKFQECIDFWEKGSLFYKGSHNPVFYEFKALIAETLAKMGRKQEALSMLQHIINEFPAQNDSEKRLIEYGLATCYLRLKQYDLAEIHSLKLYKLKLKNNSLGYDDYKTTGQIYVESGKFAQAKPYLDKAFELLNSSVALSLRAHLHFLLYKADSAAGDYISAMRHLMKNKDLDDIVVTEAKVKRIQELQLKYESDKKDAALKFNQQHIQLLKKQSRTNRNFFIGGIIMLFLFLAMTYNRYRQKQLANKSLQVHQKEINNKNVELVRLVSEKEWLLKEVHHRVKNNLHTVISLLESQSSYLENDALKAIRESQSRVFTMSLIHQRLYQSENVSMIDMSAYLPELVNYLSDIFNSRGHIYFDMQVDPIKLDVAQAIPVGLILNEAITNSIKYAFPLSGENKISVSLRSLPGNQAELSIADNGIGFAEGFDVLKSGSLGVKLMRGLTEDLGGHFSLEYIGGIKVTTQFPIDHSILNIQKSLLTELELA